jgi:uncharacterized membrane protein YeaQ/YmgE (transglycosylase-associated protein family)
MAGKNTAAFGIYTSETGANNAVGLLYTILVAVIGAVLLTLLLRLITRGRVRQI